jgi:hypothetical protein
MNLVNVIKHGCKIGLLRPSNISCKGKMVALKHMSLAERNVCRERSSPMMVRVVWEWVRPGFCLQIFTDLVKIG